MKIKNPKRRVFSKECWKTDSIKFLFNVAVTLQIRPLREKTEQNALLK